MSGRSSALLGLYQSLFEQVKQQFEQDNSLTAKSLFASVTQGKNYLQLKSTADEQELALVEEFLKRDIANFLKDQTADDMSYSPTVIAFENTLWHWLSEITDKSQIEWHELQQDFKHHGCYKSGEIINQGMLTCDQCGYQMQIDFPGVIPDCPQCDSDTFSREPLSP
ncbi:zinc ribbon-containing protein [Shewanella aestuarii]|uniref:Zinc ribbon-containing protein n=1 Tax=Shewanella aestuarii TaxID=1028752 RepID=A0A6G9QNQ5_9GAMM|nr:zinc ribbon-containing protein [Shewanella aestuarii]QIR15469.1 zinc ribbon-containing protein [Shewanella aestuarii]